MSSSALPYKLSYHLKIDTYSCNLNLFFSEIDKIQSILFSNIDGKRTDFLDIL